MNATAEQVDAGQAVYSKRTLAIYDLAVLGISNSYIWKCPSRQIEAHYNQHITANHLDVGVGTGYFLDRCKFPTATPRVALMDLNPNSLEFTSNRISRYNPKVFRRNVLEPIDTDGERFDSIGINFLLHCLPGSMDSKSVAFDYLKALLNPNGVIFGATLLQGGVNRSWAAKRLMNVYNKKGIFSNEQDSVEALTRALKQRFKDVAVEVVGCTAMFSGRVP